MIAYANKIKTIFTYNIGKYGIRDNIIRVNKYVKNKKTIKLFRCFNLMVSNCFLELDILLVSYFNDSTTRSIPLKKVSIVTKQFTENSNVSPWRWTIKLFGTPRIQIGKE